METRLEDMTVGQARNIFKKHARMMSGVLVLNSDDFLDAVGDFLPILSVNKQLLEALEAAEKAMGRILPYLIWTVGDESPGHHPTLPSAVGAFKYSLNEEVRAAILAAKASS